MKPRGSCRLSALLALAPRALAVLTLQLIDLELRNVDAAADMATVVPLAVVRVELALTARKIAARCPPPTPTSTPPSPPPALPRARLDFASISMHFVVKLFYLLSQAASRAVCQVFLRIKRRTE